MFGLSIGKLLVIALIVLVIWYGFKRIGGGRAKTGGDAPADRVADGTQDLVACTTCGTYAPAPLTVCPSGRNDCPLLRHGA